MMASRGRSRGATRFRLLCRTWSFRLWMSMAWRWGASERFPVSIHASVLVFAPCLSWPGPRFAPRWRYLVLGLDHVFGGVVLGLLGVCAWCCPFAPVCLHLGFRILGRSRVSFSLPRRFDCFDLDIHGPDFLLLRMSVPFSSCLLSYLSFSRFLLYPMSFLRYLHYLDNLSPISPYLVPLLFAFTAFWISLGLHFS